MKKVISVQNFQQHKRNTSAKLESSGDKKCLTSYDKIAYYEPVKIVA